MCLKQNTGEYFELREEIQEAGGNFVMNIIIIIIININIKDWTRFIHSISRVTTVLANVSMVFQLFSFLVACSGMISTGFGFVAFFASVNASSFCIRLSYLICM